MESPGRHLGLPARLGRSAGSGSDASDRGRRRRRASSPATRHPVPPPGPCWPSVRTIADTVDAHARRARPASTRSPATATTASACSAARAPHSPPPATAVDAGAGAGTVLARAADAWADKAGGTSGALWGVILERGRREAGRPGPPRRRSRGCRRRAPDHEASPTTARPRSATRPSSTRSCPSPRRSTQAVDAGARLDRRLADGSGGRRPRAAAATADLLPRMGRARPHGQRQRGHA